MDRSARIVEGRFPQWNHEYWPWYLIYLPVLPLLVWHAIRARSIAFFSNVDPGIDMGGFFGERKSEIYALLPKGSYPTTLLVEPGRSWNDIEQQIAETGFRFPLIVKPDVGERGQGVTRVRDHTALQHALVSAKEALLIQALIPGQHEFGVMFAKDPESEKVALLSITGKRFLAVEGDGIASVEALLGRTYRGARQVERLRVYKADVFAVVPANGERVVVEPIGNHCRGTTFLDASALRTPVLERSISDLIRATNGVYYGRVDVRADSIEAFQAGRFSVVELNGVSSEPGHIYDPGKSIFECWSELLRHARYIPRISHQLRRRGHHPVPLKALLERCEEHFEPTPFWRWVIRSIAGSRRAPGLQERRQLSGTSFGADPVQGAR